MCGIVGVSFSKNTTKKLIKGLERLEYRGYDSCGICVKNGDKLFIRKGVGEVKKVTAVKKFSEIEGFSGIAHTRWATHGRVNEINAHPILSCDKKFSIVHNGIIDNYLEIKKELETKKHEFKTETDTEVLVHLMEEEFKKTKDLLKSFKTIISRIEGTYSILMINSFNDKIFGAKNQSPLVIGKLKNEEGYFFSSDLWGLRSFCDKVTYLEDKELFEVNKNDLKIFNKDFKKKIPEFLKIDSNHEEVHKKDDFKSFMEKEIYEQKNVLNKALIQDFKKYSTFKNKLKESKNIFFVSCGSSFHVGLFLQSLFLKKGISIICVIGSEFEKYYKFLNKNSLVFIISQSGETADLITHLEELKQKKAFLTSLVNVKNSTIDRKSDLSFYANAGMEIGVATTKAFSNQMLFCKNLISQIFEGKDLEFDKDLVNQVIEKNLETIKELSNFLKTKKSIFLIGRGKSYSIVKEGALKIKEISYIHAEGINAGELKHGTLALVEENVPVICVNPLNEEYNEMNNNINEVKARGGIIIGISEEKNRLFDYWIKIPKSNFFEILSNITLQLFALHISYLLDRNVDKPRNLAKSVTVK